LFHTRDGVALAAAAVRGIFSNFLMSTSTPDAVTRLRRIKTLHTMVWVFFVAAIVGVPVSAYGGRFDWAWGLAGVVLIEVLVLAGNRMRCPLTPMAAQFTDDRRPNFDIYLPEWLARWNKEIFGPLYALGVLYAAARWWGWLP
jgi:hypothetical protein